MNTGVVGRSLWAADPAETVRPRPAEGPQGRTERWLSVGRDSVHGRDELFVFRELGASGRRTETAANIRAFRSAWPRSLRHTAATQSTRSHSRLPG